MNITALAPWFGSKRALAPRIVAELGGHRAYWEPFCGSMAVLLAIEPCVMETVNDLHGDLINLARVIRDETLGPKLYRRLRRTLTDADSHRKFKDYLAKPFDGALDLERAYAYFVSSWVGRNGVVGTSSYNNGFCVKFTANGGSAARRFASAIETIPAWRRRLRHVTILREDAFELLPRIEDAAGTAIYIDPPYVKKGAKYVHDFEAVDHARLAEQLARFRKARVVVSYYRDSILEDLYTKKRWTHVEIEVTRKLANRDAGKSVKVIETLIVNGPSYTETNQRRLFA